jgi:hypothetical protein
MLRVTIDSTVLAGDMSRIRAAVEGLEVEISATTVTLRERGQIVSPAEPVVAESGVYGESLYDSGAVYADVKPVVFETAVIGESRLGMAVLGGDDAPSLHEAILAVISDGSFPKRGRREALTQGEKHQQRDAMILAAHSRDGRDILVSDDRKAFVGQRDAKRTRLEAICRTRIMTVDEFCATIGSIASPRI